MPDAGPIAAINRLREAIVVGLIAIMIGMTVYTLIGLAWTFKTAVETPQRLKQPFSGSL